MKKPVSCVFLLVLLTALSLLAQQAPHVRIVDLTAVDGVTLKASYFSAGKPGPGVLLLHQCDHDRKIWDGLAHQLAAAGMNVLTMDLRGYGESGDKPHSTTTGEPPEEANKWPSDIDVAFRYLQSQGDVKADDLGVGGGSCGVDNAIKTAIRHPDVKSLVLLAGPTDLKGRDFLRHSKLPIFFAVADDDQHPEMVPTTELLYSIDASPGKEFTEYKTGHHAAEMFAVNPDLPEKIVVWYETTLIKTPGHAPALAHAPSLPPEIHELALLDEPNGLAELEKKLSAARQKNPKSPFLPEQIVNYFGYQHLQAGYTKQALAILKLNAVAYPESPNVYDSLADAYDAAGDKDLARQNSEKALALLANDTTDPQNVREAIKASSEGRLKKLQATQQQ
ncbi:MAG TPA: alpha/beta fold hydrolase [Terriglobales bacterium]|nr:alpha/beta fold hydrolase [Terriglobales bacterium]